LARQIGADRVLEAGCGTGYWLTQLPDCGVRCGLDLSAGMLDKAGRRDESLELVRRTAMHLPFRQGAFDLVLCIHGLHHFDDPAAFVVEARRVLRGGGALAIIGMDPGMERDRWYLYDYFRGTLDADVARYPRGEAILRWMREAGFVCCERRLAARIAADLVGREVLNDPILHKDGTSQLSLLTEEAFRDGMARIEEAIRGAERLGGEIVFAVDIALPIVTGFVPPVLW
jgi:SAM-dependent methyltransferase